ncbi:MAG: threonine--tRNA ligase [Clostridiales bacterium]|nr:threonine--tRNA ligase [Clostridiales bacterium]
MGGILMKITLKDGSVLEFEGAVTVSDVAKAISEGLWRNAVCAKVNGELVDLSTVVDKDCEVQIITLKDKEGLDVYRHTASHVLAQAVKNIFPTSKLAIGPTIENGFYYDIEFKTPISQADIAKIESEMKDIIKSDFPIERIVYSKRDAVKIFKDFSEPYKVELIGDLPAGSVISCYKQGDFMDLCRGPHLPSTGKIKAFKLTSITGAYWRGDEKNKMLTRIYGTAFAKKSELDEYLTALEEAKKRDHNKLGRELGIFLTEEVVGQGLPILAPKGAKIMQILSRFVEDEEEKRGFMITKTPYMAKHDLYRISGHWDHYRDKMFILGDENSPEAMALRPMTCPFQYQIYKNGLKSYRDLPCRYSETATLFRKEASGEMHGLIRVRQFTLSDGHIVCTPEQIEEEFKRCLELSYYFLDCLGMREDVTFRFSKRGKANKEKYIDNDEAWNSTEALMKQILDDIGIDYVEADDEAAFYGPKLDVQAKNVYGKEDTIITIQLDFAAGKSFDMTYIDENGDKQHPFIIHRSSIGCYERTLAMLIEKYAGAFPFWICPVQVKVLSLTERTADYANKVVEELKKYGLRAEADNRNETIGYKIREATLEKVPYQFVVGDKELADGTVSVSSRKEGKLGVMSLDEIIKKLVDEDRSKKV